MSPEPATAGAAVLFVDDDPVILSAVRRCLRSEDYAVVTAESGAEALGILAERRIDVIVSDEQMPGISGGELLAMAAAKYPDVLRIILTGVASLDSALHAINACHVYGYLLKPFEPMDLTTILRRAIKQRQGIAVRNEIDLKVLSPRQREIARLVSRGLRVPHVAGRLSLSPHTVRNHLKAIFRKLDVHSQAELVARFGPAPNP
jgi:DNA-binding NarL/FixJ family response regulator